MPGILFRVPGQETLHRVGTCAHAVHNPIIRTASQQPPHNDCNFAFVVDTARCNIRSA